MYHKRINKSIPSSYQFIDKITEFVELILESQKMDTLHLHNFNVINLNIFFNIYTYIYIYIKFYNLF
jgi:hypothetical protein